MPDVPGQLKTVQSGIARLSGESPSSNLASAPPAPPAAPSKYDPAASPRMRMAYERRWGPNHGKDINLPGKKSPVAKPMGGGK